MYNLLEILRHGPRMHDGLVAAIGDDIHEARALIWDAYLADVIGISNDGTCYLNR